LLTSFLARCRSADGAQQRVVEEIAADMARPHPMHRLLQGDVGSGKTWWPRWPRARPSTPAIRPR
jgi:ATP-dependent DNA helicase RecG